MLLGCFSAGGPGRLVRIEGKLNGAMTQNILDENVPQSTPNLKLMRLFIFQQNNNSKHTAKTSKQRLQENSEGPEVAQPEPRLEAHGTTLKSS